jgi:hypothetical protein
VRYDVQIFSTEAAKIIAALDADPVAMEQFEQAGLVLAQLEMPPLQ